VKASASHSCSPRTVTGFKRAVGEHDRTSPSDRGFLSTKAGRRRQAGRLAGGQSRRAVTGGAGSDAASRYRDRSADAGGADGRSEGGGRTVWPEPVTRREFAHGHTGVRASFALTELGGAGGGATRVEVGAGLSTGAVRRSPSCRRHRRICPAASTAARCPTGGCA